MPGTETKVTPEMVEPIMAKSDDIPCRFMVSYEETFIIGLVSCYIRDCEQDCEVCHDSNGQNDWTHIYCLKDSIRFALM